MQKWIVGLALMCGTSACFAMTPTDAEHLLLRTGFLAGPESLGPWESLSRDQAVDRLVDEARRNRAPDSSLPAWADAPAIVPGGGKASSREERDKERQARFAQGLELKNWWVGEMMASNAPLNERMTLFWSNHFTSEFAKVQKASLMLRQNQLFRDQALGNYRTLVHAVARDPAMLIYLDSVKSKKGAANENFAREVLELFTLGEGHYSEQDIKEAARAFTGWRFSGPDAEFREKSKLHDEGQKTFLGQTGNLDGDDVLDIVLQQPEAADFIVAELWKEFVSPDPDPKAVASLSAAFRKNWDLAALMKSMLKEPAFWADSNRGTLVKSPVELVVGTQRALGLPMSPAVGAMAISSMGQSLFDPPNVKGWATGDAWINTDTLLARRQFIAYLFGETPSLAKEQRMPGKGVKDSRKAVAKESGPLQDAMRGYAESHPTLNADNWLLAMPAVEPPDQATAPPDRLMAWLMDPVYQLK